ncbi:MAG: type II secretion system GspH family protein [Lentisphaeraceae bacterium]|nr:type II secretion system GspH family protein [Lentisphaeraceae bacterium]
MKRKRFSMLEILAVTAVSATLTTMIVSSIKTSKDVAIQATCMSNISQMRNITELYRKDHNSLPYSETWMTDFSFAESYLGEDSLGIFKCPGSTDSDITSYSQLQSETSYYYIPSGRQLAKNIDDGLNYGLTADQTAELIASENGVIYDKSPNHHNGKVNIAYLFRDDDNNAELDGQIVSLNGNNDLLDLDGANIVNLPEVAQVTEEDAPFEEAAPEDNTVDFDVSDDSISVNEDVIATYRVLGAAISYGGQYDMAVTTQFQITNPDGQTAATPVFGDYGDAVDGNVNNGTQQEFTPENVYEAGTEIVTEATSWKKKRSRYSGDSSSHWRVYMEVDDSNSTNTKALKNGDEVPNIDGHLDQGDVESFLDGYIDENGKIVLADNQVILLFELGTTNMSSSAADFQDLVILVTFVPAPEGTESESLSDVVNN